jgi:hypothetical protein
MFWRKKVDMAITFKLSTLSKNLLLFSNFRTSTITMANLFIFGWQLWNGEKSSKDIIMRFSLDDLIKTEARVKIDQSDFLFKRQNILIYQFKERPIASSLCFAIFTCIYGTGVVQIDESAYIWVLLHITHYTRS